MAGVAVVALRCWFIGLAKADQIRCDYAMIGGNERRNHFAIEIRPTWFAVQQQKRVCIGWTLIDVVHSQTVDLDVMWRKVVAGQVDKARIGCADCLHAPYDRRMQHPLIMQ